jgi:hypothetical protein
MDEERASAEETSDGESKTSLKDRLRVAARVAAVLAAITCVNLIVWWSVNRFSAPRGEHLGLEVTIGEFAYAGDSPQKRVEFGLHIAMLSEMDRQGRNLLDLHEHKVRQSIEELLRKSEDTDFADPSLRDLKRRIQEAINESVGNRIVGEVIITDFVATRVETPVNDAGATASAQRPEPAKAIPATVSTSG